MNSVLFSAIHYEFKVSFLIDCRNEPTYLVFISANLGIVVRTIPPVESIRTIAIPIYIGYFNNGILAQGNRSRTVVVAAISIFVSLVAAIATNTCWRGAWMQPQYH